MDDRRFEEWIAENVFGHKLAFSEKAWTDDDWMSSDTPTERNVLAIVADDAEKYPGPGAFRVSIPHYLTDRDAAWSVFEAPILAELLPYVERTIRYFSHKGEDRYECHIENDTAEFLFIEEAPTVERAICLAVRSAVEGMRAWQSRQSATVTP